LKTIGLSIFLLFDFWCYKIIIVSGPVSLEEPCPTKYKNPNCDKLFSCPTISKIPGTLSRYYDSGVFLFYHDQPTKILTGTTYTGLFFPNHNMKGLLFPNQKRLGPFPKIAHTPSESGTGPSASSHMDTSHSCREPNLPDSELMRLGSALPSRVFLS